MINAWSLAWEALNGTMDEEYPIKIDTSAGAGNTAFQYEDDGLDASTVRPFVFVSTDGYD